MEGIKETKGSAWWIELVRKVFYLKHMHRKNIRDLDK
jgi:hypothetical protein